MFNPLWYSIGKEKGSTVLKNLTESNKNLMDMAEEVRPPDQIPSKQKLAAAAYQVAKHTKELVALFDSGMDNVDL